MRHTPTFRNMRVYEQDAQRRFEGQLFGPTLPVYWHWTSPPDDVPTGRGSRKCPACRKWLVQRFADEVAVYACETACCRSPHTTTG